MSHDVFFQLKDVWKIYKNGDKVIHALLDINHSFNKGSFNIVYGPSGSGKSTLISIMGLLERPTIGNVLINGENTVDLSVKMRNNIIRNEIGMIFQSSNLIPTLNVLDNLTLPMITSDTSKAKELLEKVDFYDYKKLPTELSVEEEQRVSIARAMVNNHSIILADEPTGGLHSSSADSIVELLMDLNRNELLTVVLTTNNEDLSKFSTPIQMKDGKIT